MNTKKLKEILESPKSKAIVVGAAGAGAYSAGCMLVASVDKIPVVRELCSIVTIPASIFTGALAYLIVTDYVSRMPAVPESEETVMAEKSDMVET